jgi:hypothetical protein
MQVRLSAYIALCACTAIWIPRSGRTTADAGGQWMVGLVAQHHSSYGSLRRVRGRHHPRAGQGWHQPGARRAIQEWKIRQSSSRWTAASARLGDLLDTDSLRQGASWLRRAPPGRRGYAVALCTGEVLLSCPRLPGVAPSIHERQRQSTGEGRAHSGPNLGGGIRRFEAAS